MNKGFFSRLRTDPRRVGYVDTSGKTPARCHHHACRDIANAMRSCEFESLAQRSIVIFLSTCCGSLIGHEHHWLAGSASGATRSKRTASSTHFRVDTPPTSCRTHGQPDCQGRPRMPQLLPSGAAHLWTLTSASASNIAGVRSRRAIVRAPSRAATNAAAVEDARAGAKPHPLKCSATISVESTNPRAIRLVSSASSAGSSFARFCIRHPYWKSEATISAANVPKS